MSRFLSSVAALNEVNKMTVMNLATVFAQSFIYPEEDEPALMMGTASNRTQVVFVLIQFWESLFKVEYTARGAAVMVDNLLDIHGAADSLYVDGDFSNVALRESTSMDLMGLDLSGELPSSATGVSPLGIPTSNTEISPVDTPVRPARKAPKIPPRPASPPKTESATSEASSRLYPSLPRDVESAPVMWADSPPAIRRGDSPPVVRRDDAASMAHKSSVDVEPEAGQNGIRLRQVSVKRDRRGWHMDEAEVEKEVVTSPQSTVSKLTESSPPAESTPVVRSQPQIPPRPKQRSTISSTSEPINGNAEESAPVEEEVDPVEVLISMDLTNHSHDDLLNHIKSLCTELKSQRTRAKEQCSNVKTLEAKLKSQHYESLKKLDQEKTSTAEAVDRIMVLSRKLEAYSLQYGDLE